MRAFLAVALATDVRERIAALQQELKTFVASTCAGRIRVTWVKPETIHLTLKFLGEIDADAVEPLRVRVSAAMEARPAVDIPIGALGAFPRIEAPRALWIGPPSHWSSLAQANQAEELAARIEQACEEFAGAGGTHPWRPHLTIARVREGEREIAQALRASGLLTRSLQIGSLRVGEISLMKSEMRPDGPVHTPLWSVSLIR